MSLILGPHVSNAHKKLSMKPTCIELMYTALVKPPPQVSFTHGDICLFVCLCVRLFPNDIEKLHTVYLKLYKPKL